MAEIIDKDRGYKALMRRLEALRSDSSIVRVGYLDSGKNERSGPDKWKGGPRPTNLEVALFAEFGTKTEPSRPFMRNTFDTKVGEWNKIGAQLVERFIDGKLTIEDVLGILGERAAADVKKTITSEGVPPPNAPATVESKGSSKTLIDSAQLVDSTTYEVGKGGEE